MRYMVSSRQFAPWTTVGLALAAVSATTVTLAYEPRIPNFHGCVSPNATSLPYCNGKLSIDARLDDLVGRLTLDEKIGLISPAKHGPTLSLGVPRLGLPDYNWLTEANTVIQAACAGPDRCPTTFPGPLNMAASFNRTNWRRKGSILGTEQRALGNGDDVECYGSNCQGRVLPPLTAWGPNINIVRHPLFGRNSELPGESPFLNGHYAKEMVTGLQEEDSAGHPKVLAYLKHYTMYNGPQATDIPKEMVSLHDLHETYLAQYKIAFVEGNATGAMCSYNSTYSVKHESRRMSSISSTSCSQKTDCPGINGTTSCANAYTLGQIHQWCEQRADQSALGCTIGTDWGAMPKGNTEATAALALNAGVDLEMGSSQWPMHLASAVRNGKTSEANVTRSVKRALRPLFRAGRFDPVEQVEWAQLNTSVVNSTTHQQAIFEAALQGVSLLRNEKHTLPLQHGSKLAVLGPMAFARDDMISDYGNGDWRHQNACWNGSPAHASQSSDHCIPTVAEALGAASSKHGGSTSASIGCSIDGPKQPLEWAEAIATAKSADEVVLVLGNGHKQEREGKDRQDTTLPGQQIALALAVLKLGKPTTVVFIGGGAIAFESILEAGPGAVVYAFNLAFGAPALAASLFGEPGANRWGKLPITLYPHSFATEANYSSYDMSAPPGRTYRYYTGKPIYPFGYGLSLTTFSLSCQWKESAHTILGVVSCIVSNDGGIDGDEVVMLYHAAGSEIRFAAKHPVPIRSLIDFERVFVPKGGTATVVFHVDHKSLELVDEHGELRKYPGQHQLIASRGHGSDVNFTVTSS